MVTENVSNNAEACREKPKNWDETYKVDFVNNIDVDSIQNLEIHLENLNIENVAQSDINTPVCKLGEIFVSSAKETFGIASKPFKNKKRKVCIVQNHGLELIANLRGNITANLNGEVNLTILRKYENL